MLFLRSLLFNICFFTVTTIFSVIGLLYGLAYRDGVFSVAIWWAHTVCFLLKLICDITYDIQGYENIPQDGSYIFACKHQSAWETVMFQILSYRCAIILKQELLWIPFFGQVVYLSNAIGLNRRKGKAALPDLIAKAQKVVLLNQPIFIFPEGTRAAAGQPGKYKRGVGQLYHHLNIPIVPAALNSGYYWPRRGFIKYPGCIQVRILPAIAPGLEVTDLMVQLSTVIENACKNLPLPAK